MADEHDVGAAGTSGTSSSTLFNIARGAKGIALLCFLLPWVTVSCGGRPFMQISGYHLASGQMPTPMGLPQGLGGQASAPAGNPDIMVLLAALLIVAALVLTFVLARRTAALLAIGGSVIAAALIVVTVFVRIKARVDSQAGASGATTTPPSTGNSSFDQQMQQMAQISVDPAMGFWLCILALIAAVVLNAMVHSRRTDL
ncbi:MAG: hypothetical protein QOC65_837 [Sphingomonadales bacterium]|nr:hypothetical protein [Sphingomonadales bacterium]